MNYQQNLFIDAALTSIIVKTVIPVDGDRANLFGGVVDAGREYDQSCRSRPAISTPLMNSN
jgi:hypothetical protein